MVRITTMRIVKNVLRKPALGALLAIILMVGLSAIANAQGQGNYDEDNLCFFNGGSGGAHPWDILLNASGNVIYDTTENGGLNYCSGNYGCGVVFQLTPTGNNLCGFPDESWSETVIYSFTGPNHGDGQNPGGGLVFGNEGNLYGVTFFGGANNDGTVFKLSRATFEWMETILHNFAGSDGQTPTGRLLIDASGNVYGVTSGGGPNGGGVVYELLASGALYHETILYAFPPNTFPNGGLIMGANGVIYGTTSQGGTFRLGGIYSLTPQDGGGYSYAQLYSFTGASDGSMPGAGVLLDNSGSGNLYGTASGAGSAGSGTVYQLTPSGVFSVLYSFPGNPGGADPASALVQDASGDLYGSTDHGGGGTGCAGGCGTLFELTNNGGGSWIFSQLWWFIGGDASAPGTPVLQPGGVIFGNGYTTNGGGGAVYKLYPPQ
jgi:uncharacterized repeat protein (TIGR03803 family)